MRRTMSSSSSFSSLLRFFLLLAVVSLFIGANGKTESESDVDCTSPFVAQKTDDVNLPNDSSKRVIDSDANEDNGDADDEEDEEEDEEDSSGDGEVEEGEEEDEEEGEYEGEERDEYEDELKALAESHEAMSKDETKDEGKSSNSSSKGNSLPRSDSSDVKNFESQENVLEKQSDEDDASNEAIIDELPTKHEDKEVEDLLKYKKEKSSRKMEEEGLRKKKKRVPTVKKELSTQKEIILAGNETQVPKSLVPSEETFNVLNEDTEPVQRRDLERDERSQSGQTQEKISESEKKKFDKRNNAVPRQLKPCKTKNCEITMEEKDNLSEDKVSQTKNPPLQKRYHEERWEEIHDRFPTDFQTGLDEKDYEVNSLKQLTMDDTQKEGKKQKKKKKKKKKKKLQQRRSTITTELTMSPSTTMKPTTETDTETTTAAIQWHLLAEKWFGVSLQQDGHQEPEDGAKIQYAVTSKPSSLTSSIQRLVDRQDTTNDEKESDTERPPSPLLLPKERNLDDRSDLYPFGKTKDHRNVYDLGSERLTDYEPPERAFQRLRFGELAATSPRDFSIQEKSPEDYRDDGGPLEDDFVHNREYRPPSQDFGMSRNWPDMPAKYNRPWKGENRPLPSRLSNDWAWRQPPPPLPPRYDVNFWPARGNTWQPMRNYWPALDNDDVDEPDIDRNWRARDAQQRWRRPRPPIRQRQRQRLRQRLRQEKDDDDERFPYSPWDLEGPDTWPMASKPFQLESPWPRIKDHIYDSVKPATATTSSTTSMGRLSGKSKVSMPKISLTTWNSLTSDPATWPYKSSGAMPWPKDENGKSYNPNADLVRKLGLDKEEDAIWSTEKTEKPYSVVSDRRNLLEGNVRNSTKDEGETLTRKFKLPKDRTNFGIYDLRSKSAKLWGKQRNSEVVTAPLEPSNDDVNGWYRDDEPRKVWSPKDAIPASLPELRTVGGWVMPADKLAWMPYRYEPLNPYENINEDDSWPRRPVNVDVWDRKESLSRMDSNLADHWTGRFGNDRWNKENYALWDRKRSFDKGQPENVDAVKTNRVDVSVPSKINQTNVVVENSKEGLSLDKSNTLNSSYERSNSWPSKWKQFTYHRVTALPTLKPGTMSNSASKAKNAFVAVSVVSSPKYLPSSNTIEDSVNNRNDHFERQLEDLRRQSFWSSRMNAVEEPIRSTSPTIESTTVEPTLTTITNSTFVAHRPEEELPKSATKKYEMHLRI